MEQIVWILMSLLLVLLIIETLKRIICDFKLDREFKKTSKEFDKIIREKLKEREEKKKEEDDEEVEVL